MSSEPENLGWLIKRVQHYHHRTLDKSLSKLGLSIVQWNALREVERNPESSQHHLAEQSFNSDQAFGTLVARLKAAGFIERHQGAGRAMCLQLTPNGKAQLDKGQEITSEILAKSFSPLSANEREELTRLLTKVINAQSAEI